MSASVAVVVGAGGELGHATALTLAAEGSMVVAVDRSAGNLDTLPDDIQREVADVTDPAVVAPLIDRIAADVGVPDALVNTIGAFQPSSAADTSPDLLRTMIDVNLGAAFWLSKAVAPHMQRQGSGAIVHVTARPALEPTYGMAAYATSKAALAYLTRLLDVELRPVGIRVNSVAPQLLDTANNRAALPEEMLAHAVAPQAIADIIAFLVSDAAAPISGAILPAYG
jgi:NAD(P)-dependent dehydrogenase (short-subunit alcohol dehydrogenase family)